MRTEAGILVGSGDQSHNYGILLPPNLSLSMLVGPENMEGRSPYREKDDIQYQYKFLGVIRPGGDVSPRKSVVQSACQYDVTSRHRLPISWIWRF